MNNFTGFDTAGHNCIMALSVLPSQEDRFALLRIFRRSEWQLCPDSVWALKTASGLDEAMTTLRSNRIPIVLCDCDLGQSTWKDLLALIDLLSDPPCLIVTSRQADDRLWAEALNLGAYDVLPTPFDPTETTRTLGLAWLHWRDRGRPSLAMTAKSVA